MADNDIEQITANLDPLERMLAADAAIEAALLDIQRLNDLRVSALAELLQREGRDTADLMGKRRTNLYRAIKEGVSAAEIERRDDIAMR